MKVLVKRFGKLMNCESGGVLILVAFAMIVILGMGVIAIDVGSLYQNRRQVVNAADSSALAGVQEIVRAHQDGVTSDAGVRERVTEVVENYLGYHGADLIEITEQDGSSIGANSKTVKVVAKKEARLFFVPAFYALLGAHSSGSSDVGGAATAKLEFITNPANIRPFAIAEEAWHDLVPGEEFNLHEFFQGNPYWGSGNWGLVNFIGPGSGPGGGDDDHSYQKWIEEGYDGGAPVGSTIWTAPSTRLNAVTDSIDSIIGETIVVPIIAPIEEEEELPSGSKPIKIVGYSSIEITWRSGHGQLKIKAVLIDKNYDVAYDSSDDSIYDFGLETASLIE